MSAAQPAAPEHRRFQSGRFGKAYRSTSVPDASRARASTTMNPTLCRFRAYRSPGFPSPTMTLAKLLFRSDCIRTRALSTRSTRLLGFRLWPWTSSSSAPSSTALPFLITSGSAVAGGRFHRHLFLDRRNDGYDDDFRIGENLDLGIRLNVLHADVVVDLQMADIDLDRFRNIRRADTRPRWSG